MKCLVLAAGLSTRLAALTGGAPKPLTPVAGTPVLHRNLRWLANHGFKEVFVNLHYHADKIKASVGDGSQFGLCVHWSHEDPILGTAGAAKNLESVLSEDPDSRFVLIYGDNVFGFDLSRMIHDHIEHRSKDSTLLGTIAVFDTQKNLHTGIAGGRVASDPNGRVTGFIEGNPDAPGHVNAACYVLERAILSHIPAPPKATDWARETFPMLLSSGAHLRSYLIEGYCLGIDTPESYRCAQDLFATKLKS